MRVIKFKGKRVDNDEWVYGDLITGVGNKHGLMFILPVVKNLATLPGCHPLDGYSVMPETVGQFTGFCDINGKEIYDGDIIRIPDYRNGIYLTSKQPTRDIEVVYKNGFHGANFKNVEIVGNAHDKIKQQ